MEDRMRLWHDAVYRLHGADPFHGVANKELLECHHIVGRRDSLLRFDPLNGVPLISPMAEMQVKNNLNIDHVHGHREADGKKDKVLDAIGKSQKNYLKEMDLYTKKSFMDATNITQDVFENRELACLYDVIESSWSSDLLYWKLELLTEVLL